MKVSVAIELPTFLMMREKFHKFCVQRGEMTKEFSSLKISRICRVTESRVERDRRKVGNVVDGVEN